MCNEDLRNEFRIANVKQWEVADAIGISEMTMVKWLRKELRHDMTRKQWSEMALQQLGQNMNRINN